MTPDQLLSQLSGYFSATSAATIALDIALTLVVLVIAFVAQRALLRIMSGRTTDAATIYRWNKILKYVIAVLAMILIAAIWFEAVGNLATITAILAAGLAIALRDPIVDVGGWVYIVLRAPYRVGDRIVIDTSRGDVVDVGMFVTSLMEVGDLKSAVRQSTGRVILVPNSFVFTKTIINEHMGFGFIWHEMPVVVTFESNWEKAKQILTDLVERYASAQVEEAAKQLSDATRQFMFNSWTFTPRVYTRVIDIGVELSMRFISEVRRAREMEEVLWEEVLRAFAAESDIDFAYPTTRFYDNLAEGKPGAARTVLDD